MVNKVTLIGRVGMTPEVKRSQSKLILKFTLATGWKDKTDWHNITCFDKTAEFVEQYVRKGVLLYIEGYINYSTYEKEGIKHYYTDIVANSIQLLTPKEKV